MQKTAQVRSSVHDYLKKSLRLGSQSILPIDELCLTQKRAAVSTAQVAEKNL
jgi:hypothetical protein